MTYVKINETLYPATINGVLGDRTWDGRDTKSITLEMTHETANALFVDGLEWNIFMRSEVPTHQVDENGNLVLDENGAPIVTGTEVKEEEYDNSDYCVAGSITDNRDGTVTVKMGKKTDGEMLTELLGVLNND